MHKIQKLLKDLANVHRIIIFFLEIIFIICIHLSQHNNIILLEKQIAKSTHSRYCWFWAVSEVEELTQICLTERTQNFISFHCLCAFLFISYPFLIIVSAFLLLSPLLSLIPHHFLSLLLFLSPSYPLLFSQPFLYDLQLYCFIFCLFFLVQASDHSHRYDFTYIIKF